MLSCQRAAALCRPGCLHGASAKLGPYRPSNPSRPRADRNGSRGCVAEQGLLDGTVIVSDGAGQFKIAEHALCWVHAERLIHKPDTFCEAHLQAKEAIRTRIWQLYKDLKSYRLAPTPRRAAGLKRRFDSIFATETGFVTLDRLLARLRAQKKDLLAVLKQPQIPLHTRLGKRYPLPGHPPQDLRRHALRSRPRRPRCLPWAYENLLKQAVSFWDYLGHRLDVQPDVARLASTVPPRRICAAFPPVTPSRFRKGPFPQLRLKRKRLVLPKTGRFAR